MHGSCGPRSRSAAGMPLPALPAGARRRAMAARHELQLGRVAATAHIAGASAGSHRRARPGGLPVLQLAIERPSMPRPVRRRGGRLLPDRQVASRIAEMSARAAPVRTTPFTLRPARIARLLWRRSDAGRAGGVCDPFRRGSYARRSGLPRCSGQCLGMRLAVAGIIGAGRS